MSLERPPLPEVGEAEFADVDHFLFRELDGIGAEIPRLHLVLAHLYPTQVPYSANLCLVLRHTAARAEFFDLFLAGIWCVVGSRGFGGGSGVLHVDEIHFLVFELGSTFENFGLHHSDIAAFVIFDPIFFAASFGGSAGRFALGVRGRTKLRRCGYIAGAGRAGTRTFLTRFGRWCFGGWGTRFLLVRFVRGWPFDFTGKVDTGGGDPFCSI